MLRDRGEGAPSAFRECGKRPAQQTSDKILNLLELFGTEFLR